MNKIQIKEYLERKIRVLPDLTGTPGVMDQKKLR